MKTNRFSITSILRTILNGQPTPLFVVIVVIIFGLVMLYTITYFPDFAKWFFTVITLVVAIYIMVIGWVTEKLPIRMSDIADVPNYNHETIDSELKWIINDPRGQSASLYKCKKIKALETIAVMKEYVWGNSPQPTADDIDLGQCHFIKVERQGSQYIIYIGLDKEYKRGDIFDFCYSREIKNAFTTSNEWVETTVTTNTENLLLVVIFPQERHFLSAKALIRHGDYIRIIQLGENNFHAKELEDGGNCIEWKIEKPTQRDTYTIEWTW